MRLMLNELSELKDKLINSRLVFENSDPPELPSLAMLTLDERAVRSPNLVRRKERQPFKRKISKVDQGIKKKTDFEKRNRSKEVIVCQSSSFLIP